MLMSFVAVIRVGVCGGVDVDVNACFDGVRRRIAGGKGFLERFVQIAIVGHDVGEHSTRSTRTSSAGSIGFARCRW